MPPAKPKVLIVETYDDARDLVRHFLQLHNYSCLAAASTDEGLALADQADLVVTGIRLRGSFDGVEFVRRLRQGTVTKQHPIIVHTACTREADRLRAVAAGCDAFLEKPRALDELLREVQLLLQEARQFRTTLRRDLQTFLRSAMTATRADFGNVQVADPHSPTLRIVRQRGFRAPFLTFFRVVQGRESACGAAMLEGRQMVVEDVRLSPVFTAKARHVMVCASAWACQSTPVMSSAGTLVGIISTHFSRPHHPSAEALRIVQQIGQQAASALQQEQERLFSLRARSAKATLASARRPNEKSA